MGKRIAALAVVTLAVTTLTQAKPKKQVMLQAHAQTNQESIDLTGQHGKQDFLVRESDSSLEIWGGMVTNDEHTVHLTLEITNYGNVTKLFVPSQIVVVLPNGHSYRPYNRADILDQAYAAKNNAKAQAYSGYNPPPVTQYTTDCSLTGNTAFCRTTPDVSAQAGYAVGFALGALIRTAIAEHSFNKYIKQVQEEYFVSQEISPKTKAMGYVDLYVEDTHAGPFTVRIPAGDKVDSRTGSLLPESMSFYDFVFGPEVINVEFPKMSCGPDGCEAKH